MRPSYATSLVLALTAPFALTPAAFGAAPGIAANVTASAVQQASVIPAVGISYDGLHMAVIAHGHGQRELTLANGTGNSARLVTLPGPCPPSSLHWAPRWNQLAVITQCGDGSAAHGAIWLLDVHAGTPPTRLLDISGEAEAPQWTSDAKRIVFLYRSRTAANHAVAAVATTGGTPQILTPPALDVHQFHVSHWGAMLAFTATAAKAPAEVPALFVQKADAGAAPQLLFNPDTAGGPLHDLAVSVPRWSYFNGSLVFIGRPAQASATGGGDLYVIGSGGGMPINLTVNKRIKPTWFRFHHGRVIATQVAGGQTQVVVYRMHRTWARQTALLFSIPGTITDGRAPGGVSMSWYGGRSRMAFFQRPTAAGAAVLRAGLIGTQPPPEVAMADTSR
ncbi:MAG: TolB family protein [Rhodanobacteraceae bacterium]